MKSLAHWRWECKYQGVFIPKYRRKASYGELRELLGELFHDLARQKECRIIAGHLLPAQVHLKGKSALAIARRVQEKERNFTGEHFWARGYAVSTIGFELARVKEYIREQEQADQEGRF
jgi:putative transposase